MSLSIDASHSRTPDSCPADAHSAPPIVDCLMTIQRLPCSYEKVAEFSFPVAFRHKNRYSKRPPLSIGLNSTDRLFVDALRSRRRMYCRLQVAHAYHGRKTTKESNTF